MLNQKVKVRDIDSGWDKFAQELEKLSAKRVQTGIQASEEATLLKYAGIHEFGGTIKHPGGTAFGFKSKADVERNRIRFLKPGQGHIVLGVTEPHEITIPSRPFIRQTFDKRIKELEEIGVDLGKLVLNDKMTLKQALELWGDKFIAFIRSEVAEGTNFEPNKPATIRAKGGGKAPLQDSGRLMNSLKSVVK